MNKFSVVAVIAMALMLVLTACGKPKTPVETMEPETSAAVPVTTQTAAGETAEAETTEEEPWKVALAEDLFSKYGVLPEYYEDLGDGIYQVYVEVGGEIVPFVTVNSATGDYHG